MLRNFYKRYQPVLSEPMTMIVVVTGILILIARILELVNFPIPWVSPLIATIAAGADVEIETADVALMPDDLNKVAEAMVLSKLV